MQYQWWLNNEMSTALLIASLKIPFQYNYPKGLRYKASKIESSIFHSLAFNDHISGWHLLLNTYNCHGLSCQHIKLSWQWWSGVSFAKWPLIVGCHVNYRLLLAMMVVSYFCYHSGSGQSSLCQSNGGFMADDGCHCTSVWATSSQGTVVSAKLRSLKFLRRSSC